MLPRVDIERYDTTIVGEKYQNTLSYFCGYFNRGIPDQKVIVHNELDLKINFGKPDQKNYDAWLQLYDYLQLNNSLIVERKIGENSLNSGFSAPNKYTGIRIDNPEQFSLFKNENFINVIARNPGEWGDSIRVAFFGPEEKEKNKLIYAGLTARQISKENSYTLAVFLNESLLEKYEINNFDFDYVNESSEYIFINYDKDLYDRYDGNLFYIDGNLILADGNEKNKMTPVFYGSNIIKLSGGYSEEPQNSQILEGYNDACSSEEFQLTFLIGNPVYPGAAISAADKYHNAIAIVDDGLGKAGKSDWACCYTGKQKVKNIFNGKTVQIGLAGDIAGIRANIIENADMSRSHCKPEYGLKNILDYSLKGLTQAEQQEFYDKNENILILDNSYYSFYEQMMSGKKLTNKIIELNLKRECESICRWYLFEFNDEQSRAGLRSQLLNTLGIYKGKNRIEDFRVICDSHNQDKSRPNEIIADIYYQPKYLVEGVKLRFVASNF